MKVKTKTYFAYLFDCIFLLLSGILYLCIPVVSSIFKQWVFLTMLFLSLVSFTLSFFGMIYGRHKILTYSEYNRMVLIAVVLIEIIFAGICFRAVVKGNSMKDTLHNGDCLLVVRTLRFKEGDIVVVCYKDDIQGESESIKNNELLVKRIKHLPGDDVNGEKLKDDEYWVEGDNKEDSYDSREFGPVTRQQIFGICKYRIRNLFKWEKLS